MVLEIWKGKGTRFTESLETHRRRTRSREEENQVPEFGTENQQSDCEIIGKFITVSSFNVRRFTRQGKK